MGNTDNPPKASVLQKGGRSSPGGLTLATVGWEVMFTTLVTAWGGGAGVLVDPKGLPRAQTREEKAGLPEASLNAL